MLDPCPDHGDDPVDVRVDGVQRATLRRISIPQNLLVRKNTVSRVVLTYPLPAKTDVSLPCRRSSQTWLSWSLAVVVSKLSKMPLSYRNTSRCLTGVLPHRAKPEERPLRRQQCRNRELGRHRIADRDLQIERRRSAWMADHDSDRHRGRCACSAQHHRPIPLELHTAEV